MSLENSLANYSFLLLLVSVIAVWFETLIPKTSEPSPLPPSGLAKRSVGLSAQPRTEGVWQSQSPDWSGLTKESSDQSNAQVLLLVAPSVQPNQRDYQDLGSRQAKLIKSKFNLLVLKNYTFTTVLVLICNILLSLLLIVRWKESGHFPLSNLYESLMFLSWCFTLFYLRVYSTGLLKNKKESELMQKMVGCVAIPCALLCNAFASFTLPKEMQEASPLVPALQSNWLMMHVSVMILSYAALILGSLMSIAFLILSNSNFLNNGLLKETNLSETETSFKENQNRVNVLVQEKVIQNKNEKIALMLDNLSYRILALGFPLLTIGILSGAVWANEAWGSYWSWDPKETWALLTWLVFAVYLHTRLSKGWQGKKPAIIASFGFFVVWMCYLGVNLIGEGLHSYGWIVKS